MTLSVGIVGSSTGWNILLEQEGVPYSFVDSSVSTEDCSVLVVAENLSPAMLESVKSYLAAGGAVLCSAKTYGALTRTPLKESFASYLVFRDSKNFTPFETVRLYGVSSFLPSPSKTRGIIETVFPQHYSFGKGTLLVLPFDAGSLVTDTRSNDFSFYSPSSRLPFEHVSTVSKHTVRRLVSWALEYLHHARGLPYIHLWYYPHDAGSIFALRIDTDGATPEQVKQLFVLLHRLHLRASWFLDLETQETLLPFYKTFGGHELGVHCFHHQHWQDERSFRHDLELALSVFHQNNLQPKGFAAPYGQWKNFFSLPLQRNGFEYSSEFSYDYDNLPSAPANAMLQVPVHPVCIGSMKRHSYTDEMMKQYFDTVLTRKVALREPLLFYHHPRDGRENVLEHLIQHSTQNAIPVMTFGEIASWWKRRTSIRFRCSTDGQILRIIPSSTYSDILYHITFPDGTETFIDGNAAFPYRESAFQPKVLPYTLPQDFLRICKFNYRIPLIRSTDTIIGTVRKVLNR